MCFGSHFISWNTNYIPLHNECELICSVEVTWSVSLSVSQEIQWERLKEYTHVWIIFTIIHSHQLLLWSCGMLTSKSCLIRLTRQASMWPSLWPAQNISEWSSKLMFLCSCHCRHSASLRIGTVAFCNILVPVLPVKQKVKLQYYWVSGLHQLCNILGRKEM